MTVVMTADSNSVSGQRPFVSWPLVIGLVTFLLAITARQIFWDPDTYWHIASGNWILANHAVPERDPFSHSMAGTPWTVHEWGSQVLIATVYKWFGWGGLQVLVAAAFASTMALLARFLSKRLEPVHMISGAALVATLLWTHYLVRPHVLAWPMLAIWVGSFANAAEHRRLPPWSMILLMVVWANMHLSYTLALAIGAGFATDAIMQESTWPERFVKARAWAIFLVACTAALLINPHGWYAIKYTVDVMGMTSLNMVSEWRSADFHDFQMVTLWVVLVFGLALGGWFRLSWPRTVLILVLFYMALKHQRYHSLLGLVSMYVLAEPFARQWYARPVQPTQGSDALDRLFRALQGNARLAGVGLALLVSAAVAWARLTMAPPVPPPTTTPSAALAAFDSLHVRGNVFNSYVFGGYLIFRGVPVMIDGRSDMYGDSLMQDVSDAVQLKKRGTLERVLEAHHITWSLLTPSTPATQLLDHLPGWERVYADSIAVVHVRTDALNGASR